MVHLSRLPLTRCPQRETPYEETLSDINELYSAGHFSRSGICSFAAWEVAQICERCDRHGRGLKRPDVYQASYNACEAELFPCLRRYGIAIYEFSPLAGGMLSDRYQRDGADGGDGNGDDGTGPSRKGSNSPSRAADLTPMPGAGAIASSTGTGSCGWCWRDPYSRLKEECTSITDEAQFGYRNNSIVSRTYKLQVSSIFFLLFLCPDTPT